MLRKFLSLLMLTSGTFLFYQNDYKIDFERMELFRHNEEYARNFKLFTYKYNRTTPVVNATFTYTTDLGNDIQVTVQAYTFLSNEYRLFPIRFQFDFCRAAAINDFGLGGFYKCGNFSRCPIAKGRYQICNWAPEESRFPPHIPDGKYMIDLEVTHKKIEIMVLRLYARAYRPIPYHK